MKCDVLVFGSSGQVGSAIIRKLEASNISVRGISTKAGYSYHDLPSLATLIQSSQANYIINCVAWTDVNGAEKPESQSECYYLNVVFPTFLANICSIYDRELIHFSTDYVFDGEKENGDYEESNEKHPLQYYGKTKAIADDVLSYYRKVKNYRVQCVYGNDNRPNFVNQIKRKGVQAVEFGVESIPVVTDQWTVPTHADWIAENVVRQLDRQRYGLFHLAPNGGCSFAEFAEYILSKENIPTKVQRVLSTDFKSPVKRPAYSVLSNRKFVRILEDGVEPMNWQQVYDKYKQ